MAEAPGHGIVESGMYVSNDVAITVAARTAHGTRAADAKAEAGSIDALHMYECGGRLAGRLPPVYVSLVCRLRLVPFRLPLHIESRVYSHSNSRWTGGAPETRIRDEESTPRSRARQEPPIRDSPTDRPTARARAPAAHARRGGWLRCVVTQTGHGPASRGDDVKSPTSRVR